VTGIHNFTRTDFDHEMRLAGKRQDLKRRVAGISNLATNDFEQGMRIDRRRQNLKSQMTTGIFNHGTRIEWQRSNLKSRERERSSRVERQQSSFGKWERASPIMGRESISMD
jgi:hypothetical protein